MRFKENEATFQVNVVVKYSKGKYDRKWNMNISHIAVYNMNLPIKKHI
jgi:putative transposase